MTPLMLEGEVDETAGFINALQHASGRIRELEAELAAARLETVQAKRETATATANLRKLLKPYYATLKQVFGELDAIGGEDTPATNGNPKWESWKQRMPGRPAEFIDLLLVHGSMSVKQFMAATHCGQNTVYQTVSKLGQAGVVVNAGGRYSLKP